MICNGLRMKQIPAAARRRGFPRCNTSLFNLDLLFHTNICQLYSKVNILHLFFTVTYVWTKIYMKYKEETADVIRFTTVPRHSYPTWFNIWPKKIICQINLVTNWKSVPQLLSKSFSPVDIFQIRTESREEMVTR